MVDLSGRGPLCRGWRFIERRPEPAIKRFARPSVLSGALETPACHFERRQMADG
ncbi:hypothetical protein Salmuc_03113 [Salipiger mucosus DSM 16094]|uniref:Uncharacterized protein n=1 Tax=Salipiger mucosus DSM 16094 TaxID=1123237 RepID=S9Q3B2_9RHOB|nr:hypothetical protein Salmuc_03113 [Salipiger mucosus DSM 16094]